MSTTVQKRAAEARDNALSALYQTPEIQERTRNGMLKISEACRLIIDAKEQLSVSNVSRMLGRMYPGDYPAEQSIRNNTVAGRAYREVISVWKTYLIALGQTKTLAATVSDSDDVSDSLINMIEPKSARLVILSMRTSLRNMRRQLQILKSVTPELLLRAPSDGQAAASSPTLTLTPEETEAIEALLDEKELLARGCQWDRFGRLTRDEGLVISRPHLKGALEKMIRTD